MSSSFGIVDITPEPASGRRGLLTPQLEFSPIMDNQLACMMTTLALPQRGTT
jgi:hypothetical protein